jgi:hypothetical protein
VAAWVERNLCADPTFLKPCIFLLGSSELRIEIAFEGRRRVNALDDNKIIVLPFQARRRKVRGAGAQQSPVDLVAFEVHRRAGLALDPYLDTRRLGEVKEDLCRLALGKLGAVEIDTDRNTAIDGARERLNDGPVSPLSPSYAQIPIHARFLQPRR